VTDRPAPVQLRPADAETALLWGALGRLASQVLPPGWTLVGGLMDRWRRGELVLDLLAPEGLRADPLVAGHIGTVQITGGTQALARTETVEVVIDGHTVPIRRPTLSGALLIKARAIRVHADPDAQRADLVLLLSLIEDPSDTVGQLQPTERRWLQACEAVLGLDDPLLTAAFPQNRVRRARLAYRLLTTPAQR
jgi:hypothetical protein